MKPRVDQRKGGNGFGVNCDGAGYTLTAVDRHGVAYGVGYGGQGGSVIPSEETQPTLVKDDHKGPMPAVVQCYENHAQDSRVRPIEVSDTRNQKDGTGGNNLPLIVSINSNGVEFFTPGLTPECSPTLKHGTGDHRAAVLVNSKAKEGAEGE